MFSSLSRGSSKLPRSYICSSCLCNLLKAPIAPLNRPSTAKHALFSTTTAHAQASDAKDGGQKFDTSPSAAADPRNLEPPAEATKGIPETKSGRRTPGRKRGLRERDVVHGSVSTLKKLRRSLEAEEQAQRLYPAQLESPTAIKGQEESKAKSPKAKAKTKTKRNPPGEIPIIRVLSKVANAKANLSGEVAIIRVPGTVSVREEAMLENVMRGGAPDPLTGFTIRRSMSRPDPHAPSNQSPKGQSLESAARKRLVASIQDGSLSEAERKEVLRLLRASLLTRMTSTKAPGSTKRPRAEFGLKEAMQRPRFKQIPPQRIGIEVPYKVGEPRAGNTAPLRREAPGPVKNSLGPKFLRNSMSAHEIEIVKADDLELTPVHTGHLDVPNLAYGLERVLFNPGVYQLQDPRTRVFNFDPYLQTIMPVSDFDFNALQQYVTSSKDKNLMSKAAEEKKKYTGSTSSMTSALSHFHFLLSQWRLINVGNLSKMFPVQFHTFTAFQRAPVSIFLRYKDGTYAIDADKQFDGASILSMLGKSMEKLLTLPTEDFERYRKGNSDQISEAERNEPEAFHYTTMGDFLLRSQLDAYDARLPGTGMFDLKTRAVISVRMDTDAYEEGRGYQIHTRHGEWESFEREYYDMIRSAFLKYSLQVRMGRMDGIFVAFHNTERIFGFQYISLEEMDYSIHGTDDRRLGDAEFKLSLDLLNRVIDRATAKYPEKSLRIHFEARDAVTPFMYIFAEPVDEEEIETIQASNKSKIEEFESKVLGLKFEESSEQQKQARWDKMRARVEQAMEQDEHDPERQADENENDVGAMTEEERHEIQALISSNSLSEDNEEVIDEETEEFDEDTEEGVVDDVVELEEDLNEDDAEMARSSEFAEDIETTDAGESSEIGSAQIDDVEVASLEESSTSVEENDEFKGDEETTEASSASDVEDCDTEDTKDELADETKGENFVDEDAIEGTPLNIIRTSKRLRKAPKLKKELLAMTLTIRNIVNGEYVAVPDTKNYPPGAKWNVEYALSEVHDAERAKLLYTACKFRRARIHLKGIDMAADVLNNDFLERIRNLSREGRVWRDKQQKIEEQLPVKTLYETDKKPSAQINPEKKEMPKEGEEKHDETSVVSKGETS